MESHDSGQVSSPKSLAKQDMISALMKKVYNPKSAKNLETFPPKFQVPEVSHTEPDPSNSSKSQLEEEKKDSLGSGFANYSFFKAQSEQSNSSSRNSSHGPAIVSLSREPSED